MGCNRVFATPQPEQQGLSLPNDALGADATAVDNRSLTFRYILEFQQEESALRKESASSLKSMAASMGLECASRSTRAVLAKSIMNSRYGAPLSNTDN